MSSIVNVLKPAQVAVVLFLLACAVPQSLQGGAFIKFDGIDGESRNAAHKGWCDLQSFSQSISSPLETASGSTRRRGAAVFADIVCVKELDKASPKLAEAIAKGMVIPKVEIHLTANFTDSGQATYLTYELKNVMISSYSVSGSAQVGVIPMDSISLNFEEIRVVYTESDSQGRPKGNVEYSWKMEEETT